MQCTRQKLRVWTVDAFSSQPFGGNPAAVCIIDDYNVPLCKLIAREMKHAETAFVIPRKCSASSDGSDSKSDDSKKDNTNNCNGNVANLIGSVLNQCNNYDIRWWTPIGKEINMCGHATLAAAHILYSEGFADCNEKINFNCLLEKTTMSVSIVDNKNSINSNESFLYEMNFPKIEFHKLSLNLKENSDSNNKIIDTICKALNVDLKEDIDTIIKGDNGKYLMINVKFDVRKVKPDLDIIKQLPYRCCIVTCDSSKCIGMQYLFFVCLILILICIIVLHLNTLAWLLDFGLFWFITSYYAVSFLPFFCSIFG